MTKKLLVTVAFGCVFSISLVFAGGAEKNVAKKAAAGLERIAHQGNVLSTNIPAHIQEALSSGGRRLIEIDRNYGKIKRKIEHAKPGTERRDPALPEVTGILAAKEVSDPNAPFELASRLAGFTQSETSAGWCGSNAVIGWNDSGSLLEQLLVSPTASFSFNGYGISTDTGKTFTDQGFLNSDPVPPGAQFYDLGGDPVIRCTEPNTFYYASLATFIDFAFAFTSDISVSKSTDGGASFGGPIPAASKDGETHFLDKPWMAVDPTNPNIIIVTYTDFDFSETSTACPGDFRAAIEVVRSTNGGTSWSAPVVVAEVCGNNLVQGSNTIVDNSGNVYVAYEDFGDDFPFSPRSINIRTSTDGGVSFDPVVKIADVVCVGDCFLLQGGFRNFVDMPGTGLAVDRSGGPFDGRLYACWGDGGNFSQPDPLLEGVYNFGDILCGSSDDEGATWSSPVRVNDDFIGPQDIDQFQASVAVDRKGHVGVLFYDRRDDPRNFLIGATLAVSKDGGVTFTKQKSLFKSGFASVIAADQFINPIYMGDYNGISEDFTLENKGFVVPFAENFLGDPNVQSDRK